jgi:Xaa-Pro dipeptidase
MLQPEYCRQRQQRLLKVMQERELNAVVVGLPRHVYYFTGYLPFWLHEAAFALQDDGAARLVCGKPPEHPVAVDHIEIYESNWLGTQRQEQPALVAERCDGLLDIKAVGTDTSAVSLAIIDRISSAQIRIDEDLWQLRRRKDPDELALMRKAIGCTKAMYDRAREVIEPGVPELRVYTELHAAAVETAGEPLSPAYLGNDFRCAAPGGPPRDGRTAQPGELYILDLGPAYRGYFSDNCRTFAVDRKPTDAQRRAWEVVTEVFPIIEKMAKPGVRCRELFAAIDDLYRARTGQPLPHHLGHGVGLQPHEYSHLNPKWDDTLQDGEVFTCEPGLYSPELAAGMRIENQYLVTPDGVENLTPFPMDL